MSIRIKYANLHHQTWIYRRTYPKDVATMLGKANLKQTLRTSDASVARKRVRELDAKFDEWVEKVRSGAAIDNPTAVQVAPVRFQGVSPFLGTAP